MDGKTFTRDQFRLYELIWRRAVASQMTQAVYDVTTLQIAAGRYGLKASGSQLKFDGYLRLGSPKDLTESRGKQVPFIAQGAPLMLAETIPGGEQHFTEPPPHYTEAALVKELEEQGIGRPSTYATIIQTIQDRGYVRREQKKLLTTDLGVQVVELLVQYFGKVINIPYSAQLEAELDEIAEHKRTMLETLEQFYEPFHALLEVADKEIVAAPPVVIESDVVCEKCGRRMVVKEGRYGKFLACPGFPECRNTKPILEKIGVPCPKCHEGDVIARKTRGGGLFYGCSRYPECDFTSWDKPSATEKCPLCGSVMMEHLTSTRRKMMVCSNPDCEKALKTRKRAAAKAEAGATEATTTVKRRRGRPAGSTKAAAKAAPKRRGRPPMSASAAATKTTKTVRKRATKAE